MIDLDISAHLVVSIGRIKPNGYKWEVSLKFARVKRKTWQIRNQVRFMRGRGGGQKRNVAGRYNSYSVNLVHCMQCNPNYGLLLSALALFYPFSPSFFSLIHALFSELWCVKYSGSQAATMIRPKTVSEGTCDILIIFSVFTLQKWKKNNILLATPSGFLHYRDGHVECCYGHQIVKFSKINTERLFHFF